MGKRLCSLLLSAWVLLCLPLQALAAQTGEAEAPKVYISSVWRLLSFAEKCRLDSYSEGLTAVLTADLDVSMAGFAGIPSFSGTFEGNGHTISGLNLTADGSDQGLFRYLTDTALVQNLNVRGSVAPGGSRSGLGGLAGRNAGTIRNCGFEGSVAGADKVGGIAGENAVTGIIENCRVQGSVCGNHFVGGIAGQNNGVIRNCRNGAGINTTAQQNTVSLSDITLKSLTTSESASTATDIGGIAGNSTGVIRGCVNTGSVGYQHMGYNIGGICGTQSGYLHGCDNQGTVLGRKEVGGIVGQMEPTALVEYDQDVLQILQGQLNAMSGTVNRTAANVRASGEELGGQIGTLQGHVYEAEDALALLIPNPDDPQLPDSDTLQAAKSGLSSSLSGMYSSLSGMSATTQSAVGTLSSNLYTLQSQVSAMAATLNNVSETVGGSITDVSDEDTEELLDGKVAACTNRGNVEGDLNIGGIVGAIALENDLDMEEDLKFEGSNSLNFESKLRAVVFDCENTAPVQAAKQCAGGIAGLQVLGLVKACRNTGDLTGENARRVGGVSGESTGFIRASSAQCSLTGQSEIGGIAGTAAIAADCRSMVRLESGNEKLGAILGSIAQRQTRGEEEEDAEPPIHDNFYLTVGSRDLGGIDGISYDGLAQSLPQRAFLAMEGLDDLFRTVTLTFLFADGRRQLVSTTPGGRIPEARIPRIPEKPGCVGAWDGLEDVDLSHVSFNETFSVRYTGLATTLSSEPGAAKPTLLLIGSFLPDATVSVQVSDRGPALEPEQTLLGTWTVTASQPQGVTGGRLLLPDRCDPDRVQVLTRGGDVWQPRDTTVDGSYAVFSLDGSDTAIALVERPASPLPLYAALAAGALLLIVVFLCWLRRRKRK